jgi:polar amino acid transport system substrate-binding protein
MRTIKGITALILVAGVAAACTGGAASPSPAATEAPTTAPTEAPSAPPTEAPSEAVATPDPCAPETLALKTAGTMTIGTDNPAYPPYFEAGDGEFTVPWENLGFTGDPGSGKGFESAVAYAVADKLGFAKDKVAWVVVPFTNSFAPGAKTFDFLINQVSYKPERAEAVDLSEGYYNLNQGVVALKDNPVAKAKTLADLKAYKFGAMVGTTSYDAIQKVIVPTTETAVYDTNDAALEALKAKQIDALVVDLPTANFNVTVQIEDEAGTIVGQLEPFGGTPEYFSLLLEKDSALTACVNAVVTSLREDGTLDKLASEWLPFQDTVPVLK